MDDIFQQLVSICTREKLALIAMICWNLWNRRNRWVWDRVSITEFDIQEKAMNMLNKWRQSCLEKHKHHVVSSTSPRRWQPPE